MIEPCCAPKHLLALREGIEPDKTAFFHGYGDLSFAELLPALLIRYCETEIMIVAPAIPDTAAETLQSMMRRHRAKMSGSGNLDVIQHLTLVSDLSERHSPMASLWLTDNPFAGRMTLKNVQQNDTAIILPDLALWGPMNLAYGSHFTAMATKDASTITCLREIYGRL